uniref:Precursor of insect cytokine ENF peptide n=2 Tax=Theretra japonica TaxID=644662 RepID=E1CEG8_9NEOP|nr:precursor of insect cytokine ENF peptide [Theretra japonica]
MKLSIVIFCFVLAIGCYSPVNGGSIHRFLENVKQDLRKTGDDVIHFFDSGEREDYKKNYAPAVETTAIPKQPVTVPTTTVAPITAETTTKKDGRENFAGGCATGFMRTADGRCKPTF